MISFGRKVSGLLKVVHKDARFPPLLKKEIGYKSVSEEEAPFIELLQKRCYKRDLEKKCIWQFGETNIKAFYFGIEMLRVGEQRCTVLTGCQSHLPFFKL